MNDPGALFFILMAGLAGTMTLIYFPLRIFLTATARSRRLKLLQRIRRLRDELGQPIQNWFLSTLAKAFAMANSHKKSHL